MRSDRWFVTMAILGLLALASPAFADDEEKAEVKLPKAVAKVIKEKYPKAKVRGTAKEKDEEGETVYEVELIVKGRTIDLLIDEDGEIEEIEKEIPAGHLPKAVKKAIAKAHPKATIEKAEEVTLEDDKVLYEVALATKGKKTISVVVVPNGKIIETEEEGEGESEKKEMDDDEEDDDDKPKAKKKDKGDDEDEEEEDDEDEDDKEVKSEKKPKG